MSKLTIKSEWESLTYKIGKQEFTPKNTLIKVIDPHNLAHMFAVTWNKNSTSYDDMGKTYNVTQDIPTIQVEVLGVKIFVRLELLKKLSMEIVQGE